MPQDSPIVITRSDFRLLRRLSGHPRLAAELKKAVIVDSRCVAADIVMMNSRVRYEDQNTGKRRDVKIYQPEADDGPAGRAEYAKHAASEERST